MKPFLTADWTYLTNITYAVDPALLQPHLPHGLELDTIGEKAFVSLVPFNFNNTRLRSMRIPFHTDFPELNLRFYVKKNDKRGVVFIREYVPKFMVAFIANAVYNERYRVARMKNVITETANEITARYELRRGGRGFSIEMKAENKPFTPAHDTIEHFFKEHELGFTGSQQRTRVYTVEHPVWEVFPVKEVKIDIDFGLLFGNEWAMLNDAEPYVSMFVKGSPIKVFRTKSWLCKKMGCALIFLGLRTYAFDTRPTVREAQADYARIVTLSKSKCDEHDPSLFLHYSEIKKSRRKDPAALPGCHVQYGSPHRMLSVAAPGFTVY